MNHRPFAVFDIDGTLIRWQLYHVIVDKLADAGALGPDAKRRLHEARMAWKRREHNQSFKSYERLLIDVYEDALSSLATDDFDRFITSIIDEYKDQTYVYTRNLLARLKADGYVLLIISGSHHELIEQIGKYHGFDDWLGSHYIRKDGRFVGDKYLPSQDKATALRALVDKHNLQYGSSLGIGDSKSDIAMLELVEQPVAFNPDDQLFDRARQAGWRVVVERKNMIYELEPHDGRYILAKTD